MEAERIEQVGEEVRRELVDLVVLRAQRAVSASVTAWEVEPGARELLTPALRRVGVEVEGAAAAEVEAWLAGLVEMIAAEGKSRFPVARLASFGINAAATMLLIGVFASTGGLTGTEVGVVAGAAAAQQTVLERLFGSATAARLARRAKLDLVERYERVLESDAGRFRRVLDGSLDPPDRRRSLASAIQQTQAALQGVIHG